MAGFPSKTLHDISSDVEDDVKKFTPQTSGDVQFPSLEEVSKSSNEVPSLSRDTTTTTLSLSKESTQSPKASPPFFQELAPPSSAPPPPLSRIGLNDHKAGMQGLDKARINEIIVEATKGSKYYQNELHKDQEIKKRVDRMLHGLSKVTAKQKSEALHSADREVTLLEHGRDLSHVIVHVDMDAFYAAVEMRDNPSWKEIPMAVGSKSMLSTSNYIARRYGVRAAMPGFIALKLCPELLIVSPNFSKYQRASAEIKQVLAQYDPNFYPVGLDESYLDLTECVKERIQDEDSKTWTSADSDDYSCQSSLWTVAERVVEELRDAICKKTELTASAGIAPNKMLAKIASDMNKPNGQCLVEPTKEDILRFMHSLPIRKVSGIGKVTEKMLNALGVFTCHDLYNERAMLRLAFSSSSATSFLSISLGLGEVQIQRTSERKGISTERSFNEVSDPVLLRNKCLDLCKILSKDMLEENIRGHTVTLKLKTVNFAVKSRCVTLSQPICTCEELYDSAIALLEEEIKSCQPQFPRLRLMGIRVTSLTTKHPRSMQKSLTSFLKTNTSSSTCVNTVHSSYRTDKPTSPLETSVSTGEMHIMGSGFHNTSPICQDEGIQVITCPVCNRTVSADNTRLNQHIDHCLNRSAIQEAVQEGFSTAMCSMTT